MTSDSDRSPEGGDPLAGLRAQHESATAKPDRPTSGVGSEEIARLTARLRSYTKPLSEDGVSFLREEAAAALDALMASLTTAREEIERLTGVFEKSVEALQTLCCFDLSNETDDSIAALIDDWRVRYHAAHVERDALREALTDITAQIEALEFSAYPAHGTGLVVIVTGGNTAELKIAAMKARPLLSPPDEKTTT